MRDQHIFSHTILWVDLHIYLIYLINSKTLILSHISQGKIYTKHINFLSINNFISNTEAYQRSQYRIEHKSKDAWLSWGTKRNWGVYINILQFLSNIGASQSPPLKSLTSSLKPILWSSVSEPTWGYRTGSYTICNDTRKNASHICAIPQKD